MKFVPTVLSALLLVGCQQGQNAAPPKEPVPQSASSTPTVVIDVSTPDRALKSYWQAKDALRRTEFDWSAAQFTEFHKLRGKIGFDAGEVMSGDVLSAHQEAEIPRQSQSEEYSREIVDIKQDTESRATAVVRIRNSTPIPNGTIVSDSDKKQREEGERFKYVLEKDSDEWKVSQVYKYSEVNIILKKEPWEKVFSAPTDRGSVNIYVNQFLN